MFANDRMQKLFFLVHRTLLTATVVLFMDTQLFKRTSVSVALGRYALKIVSTESDVSNVLQNTNNILFVFVCVRSVQVFFSY